MIALVLAASIIIPSCPPPPGPIPLVRLIWPQNGSERVSSNNFQLLLGSDPTQSAATYPWIWIKPELVPPSGIVPQPGLPILKSTGLGSISPGAYSTASFNFGNLRPGTNYRILVDVITPGARGCPAVHHEGVVGSFTTL